MTTTGNPPIEEHRLHADRLLDHAGRMIEAGDRLQASEKMWGAVAHALKAVADERRWHYRHHGDAVVITGYIADKVGDPEIRHLYSVAAGLHENFYLDNYPIEEIAARLTGVRRLVSLLRDAHAAMPADLEMPTERNYRMRARKALEG